jgi:hypothetical protein
MAVKKKRKKKEEPKPKKHITTELVSQMLTLATSGFGLVAALAWNSLVQSFVADYIAKWLPRGSGIISLLIYALVVTTLAVFVTFELSRLKDRLQNR